MTSRQPGDRPGQDGPASTEAGGPLITEGRARPSNAAVALGALLCLSVGAAMSVQPLLTVAAFLGLGVLALLVLRPKAFLGLAVVAVLFTLATRNATGIAVLDYSDEAAVVVCLVAFTSMRIIAGKSLRWVPGTGWMGLFLVAGLASALVHGVALGSAAQSGFLFVKGTVLAFAVAQLDWHASDVPRIARLGAATIVFILFVSAINLVIPGAWADMTAPRMVGVQYRAGGVPSLNGPFGHPVSLGHVMALAAIAVVAYRNTIGRGPWSAVLLWGSFLAVVMSFRRKAIAGVLAGAVTVWLLIPRRRGTLLLVLLAVPLLLVLSWDVLTAVTAFTYQEYVVNAHLAPRIIMYQDSAGIALRDFPLGAGFSRYGSHLAEANYSPEYIDRGYLAIWGMGIDNEGGFLTDTFWPAILGEAGLLGLLGFVIGISRMVLQGRNLSAGSRVPAHRFLGILLLAWGVEYFFESFAAPSFSAPPGFVLIFTLIGVVTALLADRADVEEQAAVRAGSDNPPTAGADVQPANGGSIPRTVRPRDTAEPAEKN